MQRSTTARILAISLGASAVLGIFLVSALPARAGSCRCTTTASSSAPPLFQRCETNHTRDSCYQAKLDWEKVLRRSNITATATCAYYVDTACTDEEDDTEARADKSLNTCWTEKACTSDGRGGGDWAPTDENGFGKTCSPIGGVPTRRCFVKFEPIKLNIPIPGPNGPITSVEGGFPNYLAVFYKFFVAMLAVVSVVLTMWGGFKRIMAAGNAEKIKDANGSISSALVGLLIALLSYTLLNLINPQLVRNTQLNIDRIKTQTLGDSCPAKDPEKPDEVLACGSPYLIDGRSCKGVTCSTSLGAPEGSGCYPIGVNTVNGNSEVQYQCQVPSVACNMLNNEDLVKKLHGEEGGNGVHMAACAGYSDAAGRCVWAESGIALGGADKCIYMSNELVEAVCKGLTFDSISYAPAKTDCSKFNRAHGWQADSVGGNEWPLCYLNLCKKFNPNLNCYAEYSSFLGGGDNWVCKSR